METLSSSAKHGGQGIRLLGGRLSWSSGAGGDTRGSGPVRRRVRLGRRRQGQGMAHSNPTRSPSPAARTGATAATSSEAVLATPERVHPFGERFVAVAGEEVRRLDLGDSLGWPEWERLFDRLTLRVIFGDGAAGGQELTDLLEKLLAEANRLPGPGGSDRYYEFGRLERYLRDPEPRPDLALRGCPAERPHTVVQPALVVRHPRHPRVQRLPGPRRDRGRPVGRAARARRAGRDRPRRSRGRRRPPLPRGLPRGGHATLADHAADRARDDPRDHLAGETIGENAQVVLINVANRDPNEVSRRRPDRPRALERQPRLPLPTT